MPRPSRQPLSTVTQRASGQPFGSGFLFNTGTDANCRAPRESGVILGPQGRTSVSFEQKTVSLSVRLPPNGTTLRSNTLPVQGQTLPGREITVNGVSIPVDDEGRFGGVIALNPGSTSVSVISTDESGNRSSLNRTYIVPSSGWFLMALSEGVIGNVGAELDGVQDHTKTTIKDAVYLHGRAVGWFRGYRRGSDILGGVFEKYSVEVHVDTARRERFETAFRQLIDPHVFYPVYGDASTERKLVNTPRPCLHSFAG